jgi:hypothetical protein
MIVLKYFLVKKIIFIWIQMFLLLTAFSQTSEKGGTENGVNASVTGNETGITYYPYDLVLLHADALKMYARSNGFNTEYAFIINMGMRSGLKRFFIVNLRYMCVENSGLVTHGRGDEKIYTGTRQYSNREGSNCTSLGKYKVGKAYQGFFGLAFALDGLEPSNNRAKDRKIVLHSMHCIPETPGENPICLSEGCPAVSDAFLPEIKKIIDHADRPVLLYIYDSTNPGIPVAKADKN